MVSDGRSSSESERGGLAAINELLDESARPRGRTQGLISSSAIGLANRGRVLQVLFDLGPTSRAELARHVGVNRATITGIIQPLIDQGLLVDGDPLPSKVSGGKPAKDRRKIAMHPASRGEHDQSAEKLLRSSPPVSRRTSATTPNAPTSVNA